VKIDRHTGIGLASIGAFSLAVVTSLALGPSEARLYLLVPGLVAIGMSVSSVVADPRELLAALVFGAMPLMALVADGTSSWFIGPLAVLLLIGAELNAWRWELGGAESVTPDARRRLSSILRLAAICVVASLGVGAAARATLFSGLTAVALAAAALAALGRTILPGDRRRPSGDRGPRD
jgi:hypothetical protein